MATDLELLAKKIKLLRRKKHLTLEKLSEMIDVSPNHISKLEAARTNPSFTLISKLAKALDVELKDMFDFEEFKVNSLTKSDIINIFSNADEKDLQKLLIVYNSLL